MSSADREKWDARYAGETVDDRPSPSWLAELDAELPREGRALDVAAGSGRLALFAARRGLDAVAVDVSDVGLALARDRARTEGLSLTTIQRDLAEDPRLPEGPFALVTCFHYEQPGLWEAMRRALGPGGILCAEILTTRNLERHAHPSRRWLIEPNALLARVTDLELVYYREGWLDERHASRLLARRV